MSCLMCKGNIIYLQSFGPPLVCMACEQKLHKLFKSFERKDEIDRLARLQFEIDIRKQELQNACSNCYSNDDDSNRS